MVLKLLQYGYHVLAHSSDSHRSKKLQAKCQGHLEVENQLQVTTSLLPGLHVRQWVVGKSDKKVLNYVPQGSKVVVFSVPNPFESGRDDLMVVPGGLLHMDLSKLSKPRQFANLLRNHDSLVEKRSLSQGDSPSSSSRDHQDYDNFLLGIPINFHFYCCCEG